MAKNKTTKKAANLAAKKATKTVATPKTEEVKTPVEGAKAEEKKPTPKPEPTVYESYLSYKKSPHMGMVSQKIEKDDKGIEQVTTVFKNNETNETVSTKFAASLVKEGDGIDLAKLREQAELGMKEYQKKHAVKAEEKKEEKSTEKPAEAKETKKPTPKKEVKEKKEKVIIPEVVEKPAESKKDTTPMTIQKGIAALANKERIDENHQVEFLGLISKHYLMNNDREIPEMQKKAMQEIFDGGMCQLTLLYAAQLEAEGRAILSGVQVTKEVFPLAKAQFAEMYGVDVKALPGKTDGQLTMQFVETPIEVKEAAKADAKAAEKKIPEANAELSDEDKLDAVRGILSRTNASTGVNVPNRMAVNVSDAIEWARKAFDIKSEEPQVTLATLYQKFNDTKTLCLTGFMRKAWGSTTVNRSPFITHALLNKDFSGIYSEKQVAELAKVMISAMAESEETAGKDFASIVLGVNNITSGITPEIIQAIIEKKETIEFAPSGLSSEIKGNGIPGAKIYETLGNLYGIADSPELIKSKLNEIAGLYKSPIVRLAHYVDESAYSK